LDVQPPLTGSLETDVDRVLGTGLDVLRMVAASGPDTLADEARTLLDDSGSARRELLLTYWRVRSDRLFFAKALLQPYAARLVRAGWGAMTGLPTAADNRCPRCGGAPQLSILEQAGAISGDGSSRHLQCATCLTMWTFRRVVCPSCGTEDERNLSY